MSSKIQERVYLDWFLQNASITCEHVQEADPPDFVLHFADKRIAAEVTRVFVEPAPGRRGSKSKQDESHRTQWLRNLAEHYYQKTDVPLRVQVLLSGSGVSYEAVSTEILSLLWNKSSELTVYKQERYELDTVPGTVKLFVRRLPDMDCFTHYSEWTCPNDHMGFAPLLSKDHIENAVRKKECSLTKYRADYDGAWLLLVVDGSWRSGILHVPTTVPQIKDCTFDAVWLVEHPEKVINLFGP